MYPILAVDFGQKHIGLAYSDAKGLIASPLKVLSITKNRNLQILISEIAQICSEYRIKSLLVGYPQAFNEDQKQNLKRIDAFISELKLQINLEIKTYDESFSTSNAKNMLISLGQHFKKSKKRIDSVAASTFLQEYLDNQI